MTVRSAAKRVQHVLKPSTGQHVFVVLALAVFQSQFDQVLSYASVVHACSHVSRVAQGVLLPSVGRKMDAPT